MTKRLEELFDLSDDDNSSATDLIEPVLPESVKQTHQDALTNLDKIEQALSEVKDLDGADKELDEISISAKGAFENLMDLGMQVDSRFSAEIFNSASSFLGHALTAKTDKINKKLKTVQLQLQKAELDRKIAIQQTKETPATTELGTGVVIDRNDLIRQILAQTDHNKVSRKDK